MLGALGCAPALSAEPGATGAAGGARLERVEITGSALRQLPDAESATPLTVIRAEDLRRRGITHVEQALAWIAASQSLVGMSASVGSVTGGKSEIDLRGLSLPFGGNASRTLVLLDGQRLAVHPYDGAAVDLQVLPLAAVERIEVLRDGASALYGSDAIGGVLNVILKREQRVNELSAELERSAHGGGATRRFSWVGGQGRLAEDGWHLQGAVDLRRQDRLRAVERDFSRSGVIGGDVESWTSGTSFPGWINGMDASTQGCDPAFGPPSADGSHCRYDIVRDIDTIPRNEQRSALLRGELQLQPRWRARGEWLWSRQQVDTAIAPAPALHCMPASSPHFPAVAIPEDVPVQCSTDPAAALVPGGYVFWRELPAGLRERRGTSFADRGLLALEGELDERWSLRTTLSRSAVRSTERVTHGYADDALMQQGVWDGVINPFGAQSAPGQAFIDAAQIAAPVQSGRSRIRSIGSVLRGELPAAERPIGLAFGAEFRVESAAFQVSELVASLPSLGLDPGADTRGRREVSGLFAEIELPLGERSDLTLALRSDRYSDFGRSTNPKLGWRFRLDPALMLRASAGTGFRAPSLYELNRPQALGFTAGAYDDPLLCPGGTAVTGASDVRDCAVQLVTRSSGALASAARVGALRPEDALHVSYGVVLAPTPRLSIAIDHWRVSVKDLIGGLPEQAAIGDARFQQRIVRCSDVQRDAAYGYAPADFSACAGWAPGDAVDPIAYLDLPTQNLGRLQTQGVDLALQWLLPAPLPGRWVLGLEGSYVQRYRYQRDPGGAWIEAAGAFTDNAPVLRWQHGLSLGWSQGDWQATLSQRFKSGYADQDRRRRVASHAVHDLVLQWRASDALELAFAVRNLADRDPPLSLQLTTFQAGYEPRLTDPLGRVFGLRASYRF